MIFVYISVVLYNTILNSHNYLYLYAFHSLLLILILILITEHRKNSFELYGFDFMIDDDYNAWLIEINSSPACDYSTKTTERYVQLALVELLDVLQSTKTSSKASTGN